MASNADKILELYRAGGEDGRAASSRSAGLPLVFDLYSDEGLEEIYVLADFHKKSGK